MRRYRKKSLTDQLKDLCDQYSLSTRGTIKDLSYRLLTFLEDHRRTRKNYPICYMQENEEEVCSACSVNYECATMFNDVKRVEKIIRRFLVRKKLRKMRGKK